MDRFAPVFVMGSFVAACSARVERLPAAGESLAASHFVLEPGGKGFNLAVGARRLGVRVDGMLAVGDDPFAEFAREAIARAGLPAEMRLPLGGPTGAGIGFIQADGENCLAVYPGANARLSAAEVQNAAARIQGAKLVLAQFEIGDAPVQRAFALARQAGVATLLNPSPYRAIPAPILEHTDILVVNRVEAGHLAGQHGIAAGVEASRELASRLFAAGLRALVVTLGAQGAMLWERNRARRLQPAFAVRAIDTLGAGDAFIAAFAAGFVAGAPLAECTRRGAAAGAIAATRPGVFEALPDPEELSAMLARAPGDGDANPW